MYAVVTDHSPSLCFSKRKKRGYNNENRIQKIFLVVHFLVILNNNLPQIYIFVILGQVTNIYTTKDTIYKTGDTIYTSKDTLYSTRDIIYTPRDTIYATT